MAATPSDCQAGLTAGVRTTINFLSRAQVRRLLIARSVLPLVSVLQRTYLIGAQAWPLVFASLLELVLCRLGPRQSRYG